MHTGELSYLGFLAFVLFLEMIALCALILACAMVGVFTNESHDLTHKLIRLTTKMLEANEQNIAGETAVNNID
ncbi:MAG: hypothetical protein PV340_01770 [Wolbachia sp.]|nr:hypothetical protein [Wolbachia sp.]MDD9336454.1 hypothetical protein [Wolbachia sp.]